MSFRKLPFLVLLGFKNKLVFANDESFFSANKTVKDKSEVLSLKSVAGKLDSNNRSITNRTCVKNVEWKHINIPKECQDLYESQAVSFELEEDFKSKMYATTIQKISKLVKWNCNFDEACSILGSIEEKYCNQNKFVAENFEDIWTQLSEGKTVKNVLESFNFEVHELVSLTKEEVEELEFFHEKNQISNDTVSKNFKKLSRLYLRAEKVIENYMKNHRIPGMECVIHCNRQTIFQKAFGTKDMENYLNYELDTQVNVGEIGAAFTALLYLAIFRVKCIMNMEESNLLRKFTQYTPNQLCQTDLSAQQILLGRSGISLSSNKNYVNCKYPQKNTQNATMQMFHEIVLNPYRDNNDLKSSIPLKGFIGASTKSLYAYQLLACEIEKAFNSTYEIDSAEIKFSDILLKFVNWLGLHNHIQVDDCTKYDDRSSNIYHINYNNGRSTKQNRAYWDYSNLMGISGIKTSAQGLAKKRILRQVISLDQLC